MKDLGVIYDQHLSFNDHIVTILNEAYKTLVLIMWLVCDFTNPQVLKIFYFSYVRSKLEYAYVVWNPQCQKHIRAIEMIQSKFLGFLTYKQTGYYPKFDSSSQLVVNFNLLTMESRTLNDIIFLFKLLNNEIHCSDLTATIHFNIPLLTTHTRVDNNFSYEKEPEQRSCYDIFFVLSCVF